MIRLIALVAVGVAVAVAMTKRRKQADEVILLPPPRDERETGNDKVGD